MNALLIPDVKREGNYIVVTFTRLHLLKKLLKLWKYKHIEEDLSKYKTIKPQLKAGASILEMEQDDQGRWRVFMPRKVNIILIHNGKDCECGVL